MTPAATERAASGTRRHRGVEPVVDRCYAAVVFALIAVIPIENVARIGPLSLSRVVAVLAGYVFVLKLLGERRLVVDRPVAIALLAFLTWASASFFWSRAPGSTLVYIATMLQLGLLVAIIWQMCTTPQRLRLGLVALATGGGIGGLLSVVDQVAAHGGAPRYAVGDPNDFGVSLSITLVAALTLALTSRRWAWAVLWYALSALQVLAILRTASRTALIGSVAGVAIVFSSRRLLRVGPLLGLAATAGLVYVLASRFTSGASLDRLEGVGSAISSGDFNHRGAIWSLALQYWTQRPLLGIGGGAFRSYSAASSKGTAVHSAPIGLLTEVGLVGLALFGVILLLCLRHLLSAPSETRKALLAMAVCWLCGALTLTLEIRKITWVLIALATCQGVAAWRARAER